MASCDQSEVFLQLTASSDLGPVRRRRSGSHMGRVRPLKERLRALGIGANCAKGKRSPGQRSRPATFAATAQSIAGLAEGQAFVQRGRRQTGLPHSLPVSHPSCSFTRTASSSDAFAASIFRPSDKHTSPWRPASLCQAHRTNLPQASSGADNSLDHPASPDWAESSTVHQACESDLDCLRSSPSLPCSDLSHNHIRSASDDRGACELHSIRHYRHSSEPDWKCCPDSRHCGPPSGVSHGLHSAEGTNLCSNDWATRNNECERVDKLGIEPVCSPVCTSGTRQWNSESRICDEKSGGPDRHPPGSRRKPLSESLVLRQISASDSSLSESVVCIACRDGLPRHGSQPQLRGAGDFRPHGPWADNWPSPLQHLSHLASEYPRKGHSAPTSRRSSRDEHQSRTPPAAAAPCAEGSVVNTRVPRLLQGPCCTVRQVVSRMLRLRYVGRCLLVLLLTAVGGLLAHASFKDHKIDSRPAVGGATSGFGGGVKVGDGYESLLPAHMMMKMHMQSVPRKEFQERIQRVQDEYDILRIFLADKALSNEAIRKMLTSHSEGDPAGGKRKRADSSEEFEDDTDNVDPSDYLDGEVAGYISDDSHNSDLILEVMSEAQYHIEEMRTSPLSQCRLPQPQIVNVEDPKKLGRTMYPTCTVIYRCRNDSGCCGSRQECGPKTEQVVFKTFLVLKEEKSLTSLKNVERIAFINHTECQCRDKPRLPDCTQKCPGVFRMYRRGWQCVCDCVSPPNEIFEQCENVKDGIKPLGQEDLVCIKSGLCGKPTCSVGEFDVSNGFCPIKNEQGISPEVIRARVRYWDSARQHKKKSLPEGSGDY